MGDILCAKCSEPWDQFGIQEEWRQHERDKFHKGVGCPSCDWGTTCVTCNATGKDLEPSRGCYDCFLGVIILRRVPDAVAHNAPFTQWHYGYGSSLKFVNDVTGLQRIGDVTSEMRGNWQTEFMKVVCPHCLTDAKPCQACDGTGKFPKQSAEERQERILARMESAFFNTDLDPFDFM